MVSNFCWGARWGGHGRRRLRRCSASEAGDTCKLEIFLLAYMEADPFCDDEVCVINLFHLMLIYVVGSSGMHKRCRSSSACTGVAIAFSLS